MPRVEIPLVGSNNEARSRSANIQRTVNWIPEQEASGASNSASLYPTPGLKLYGNGGGSGTRGNGLKWNGNGYFVSGADVVKVTPAGVFTTIGTIGTSTGRIEMVAGRSMFMLVDGALGYTYDGTTFGQIVDADFPANPISCSWLFDYFAVCSSTP